MADIDLALLKLLKEAKGRRAAKPMRFAFIPKGSEGELILSRAKIPPREIADTKRETTGGTPVLGTCYGDGRTMVFQVLVPKAVPPMLSAAIKRVVKNDTGLIIEVNIQVGGKGPAEPEDVESALKSARLCDKENEIAPLLDKAEVPKEVKVYTAITVDKNLVVKISVDTKPSHKSGTTLASLLNQKYAAAMRAALQRAKLNVTDDIDVQWLKFG